MKAYFKFIKYFQEFLLIISVLGMLYLPLMLVFRTDIMTNDVVLKLYTISHLFLLFVMTIRPLADIFSGNKWIRPLVILRKGTGVFSAAIIVSFILAKLMIDPSLYFKGFGELKYWSMVDYAVLAHLADISAIILLVTSNSFSRRVLGDWWGIIQKLSYVYFYGSVLYVYLSYGDINLLLALILVTVLTIGAFIINKQRLANSQLIQNSI
jgi:DMSO/TMAO reductase YedYZ heme-binding membrane subunit